MTPEKERGDNIQLLVSNINQLSMDVEQSQKNDSLNREVVLDNADTNSGQTSLEHQNQ